MIAVIFEVCPAAGRKALYFDHAAVLRPQLELIEGFISVERFQSLTDPLKLLSLSFFTDEAAVARWRAVSDHQAAQNVGRTGMFDAYRLRVAHVLRDYGKDDRAQAPQP